MDINQLKASFRQAAHEMSVAVGAEPEYKFYDPKTKNLYEVDQKGDKYSVKTTHNPTAEQSRFSTNINTFRRSLGEQLSEYITDYNMGVGDVRGQETGLSLVSNSTKIPTSTADLKSSLTRLEGAFQKGKGEFFGNVVDQLYDRNGPEDTQFKRSFAAEQGLKDIGPKIGALQAVDQAMSHELGANSKMSIALNYTPGG